MPAILQRSRLGDECEYGGVRMSSSPKSTAPYGCRKKFRPEAVNDFRAQNALNHQGKMRNMLAWASNSRRRCKLS
jgi:hypothetical protein